MELLFLDTETFFDKKAKYDLENLSVLEYVRDPRFKLHGLAVTLEDMHGAAWYKSPEEIDVDWKNLAVVSHNAKFDMFILREKYGIVPGQYIDTLAMARAVLGNRIPAFHLRFLADYFRLEPKGEMKVDGIRDLTVGQEEELATYCRHDTKLCKEIYGYLKDNFPASQYPAMHQTIEMFVNTRLELDVPLLEKTAAEEKIRKANLIKELPYDPKVYSSNKQFPELLASLGYPVPTKISKSTGKTIPALSVKDTAFVDLMRNGDDRLKKLCEARMAAKSVLLETRSENLAAIGKQGKWSFDVQFSGARTHRYSGGSGAGGNPQNFTRKSALRGSVRSPNGFQLVVGDFSAIELRMVAYLSNDRTLITGLEADRDWYSDFASEFYGYPVSKEDKKTAEERQFGKTNMLADQYGVGPKRVREMFILETGKDIPLTMTEMAVARYRTKFFDVPNLWKLLESYIPYLTENRRGQIGNLPVEYSKEKMILPSGLSVQYPNLRKEKGRRGFQEWIYDFFEDGQKKSTALYGGKFLENISQSLAGEKCKESMIEFEDVVGQNHDEILALASDNEANERRELLYSIMTKPPKWLPNLKLDAEIGIGRTWLEAH